MKVRVIRVRLRSRFWRVKFLWLRVRCLKVRAGLLGHNIG